MSKRHLSIEKHKAVKKYTLGIVGVRGYVAAELLILLESHKSIQIDWISSRQLEGLPLTQLFKKNHDEIAHKPPLEHYFNQLIIENLSPQDAMKKKSDIVVLALPDGFSENFVTAIEKGGKTQLIIDLSADHRFDANWCYSLPELLPNDSPYFFDEKKEKGNKLVKISNPGCYSTAMQLALAPLLGHIDGVVNCFGVSGYSGAGTKLSKNNDKKELKNNLLPYALLEHLHEKEVAYHLGLPVHFSPHVAGFFRGLSMTLQIRLSKAWKKQELQIIFEKFYKKQNNVSIQQSVPNIQQVINSKSCIIGGIFLSENGKRMTLVSCLDNLLKGAASQALQNIELALSDGFQMDIEDEN